MTETTVSGPSKVCRHCSVATPGAAADCPHCGRPYVRGAPSKKVLAVMSAAIIAGGVGLGLILHSSSHDGARTAAQASTPTVAAPRLPSGPHTISFQQGHTIPLKIPEAQLLRAFGPPLRTGRIKALKGGYLPCVYYLDNSQRYTTWQFCFRRGILEAAETLVHVP